MLSYYCNRLMSLLSFIAMMASVSAAAQPGQVNKTVDNLMVVVRDLPGTNTPQESFRPLGKGRIMLPDGRQLELELAAFEFVGDMSIRFVFDSPNFLANAEARDLERLDLTPDQALRAAIKNVRRVYGNPVVATRSNGTMQVRGGSPDLNSGYLLDRVFWQGLLARHPGGLVVAAPNRVDLLYTPLSNTAVVNRLRNDIGQLYAYNDRMRLSSGLYLFKDDRWTVFQAPQPQQP